MKNRNENVDRRNFLHKIVGITALGGITSLILGQKVDRAYALDGSGAAGQITFWSDSDSITGSANLKWDNSKRNFIGGWYGNSVTSSVYGATISGGGAPNYVNRVTANYGTIGGGAGNTASGTESLVSGGWNNTASGWGSTVGGGNLNTASGLSSTVGGGGGTVGEGNIASGEWSTISGGGKNTASGKESLVSGGLNNTASGEKSTIGGGKFNHAHNYASTVGGGDNNTASGDKSTVGGGLGNTASENRSTVGGGNQNTASGLSSTIGGGDSNSASGSRSTVGGGLNNTASQNCPTVGGGYINTSNGDYSTVSGGYYNNANSKNSTIGGGWNNTASGWGSTVPGGRDNTAAGHYSLAAGRRAKIDVAHYGALLFADQNDFDFDSAAANEFAIRCTGGARFVTDIDGSGNPTAQVSMESEGRLKARSLSVDSAQRTTIPTGVRSHDITVPSGITIGTDAMIFVTIMNNSSNIGVRWVERLSSDQFRVHLTGLSRNDMNIGYFIVN